MCPNYPSNEEIQMGLAVQQIESKFGKRGEKESKYLTFSLNEEEYFKNISRHKEL